ncbi:Unknown protein, partial [Striga hermonthica]
RRRTHDASDTEVVIEAGGWSGMVNGRTGEKRASGSDAREQADDTRSALGVRRCTAGKRSAGVGRTRWASRGKKTGRAGRVIGNDAGASLDREGIEVLGDSTHAREGVRGQQARAKEDAWSSGARSLRRKGLGERVTCEARARVAAHEK